ncbi:hypothetical protein A4H97_22240 [Niastella yeongjuensis]|uniref:Thioesterase domain-containing protein n=1 Tax=Niastella yeongjuensis TaxID=354355 RepID=A0A1V9F721_9BACT|nr:alpha/beta fold hydrolase [Niastella yeongjuensis]OQP54220.1 hypothetical protein A4H97_22240 [Niastella yeongjuensis]SEP31754.1 Surfactin synthase thioesterase subunit [Niastella yeongjuensis]
MSRPRLCLLHFAGGNCYSFQFLTPLLKDFEVWPLELPGRGKRITEPLLKDFDHAVEDLFYQINRQQTAADLVLYGHSLGAYLAFGLAQRFEESGKPAACLLVSGNAGPGAREPKNRYLMKRSDFIEELKLLGGIPQAFLDNEDLIDFFEPILRADFELAERNELANATPIDAPIFAMMGSMEEEVTKIANWKRFTHTRFDHEILEGDHFFINRHAQRIAAIIRTSYAAVATNKTLL